MLKETVCVVTGASRGVGRGVAIGLGAAGATVYVTGRTANASGQKLPGTVYETADAVTAAGGRGIPVICDHGSDAQVRELFERVNAESGALDILVNCAIAIPDGLTDVAPFWEKPLGMTDLFGVGMRSTYVASYYAAPLLLKRGSGLIVNISSAGGRCYMHGPAYGAAKAATDKMSFDMAHDFAPYGVHVVTLWPGLVKTERTLAVCNLEPEKYGGWLELGESPEFQGRLVAAIFEDPARASRSGKVFYGAELALEYGVRDIDGKQPPSHRPMLGDPPEFSAAVVE
ncbi:NAD(P)-dependent dehydrogenase (short-subunit alcohol dehydrogenase family) [Paraburkholderia sp. BL18I3N2]|uniref:SDR family NAD(P)-dependent oxidoreductase n=1 Tax=Paraburkholderia sp. BL18I3N2 TaxID=1938799 RepID=UPI000D06F3DD|nr:SDR family NAD(P)-dependent oxidoreductase [Paraburkholderia sp. BL18I3N2]PRX27371.1 NAD(P)-dependent dehydrogenase (short-subunit alcohol dehydrogenase family) [Paraburkholderia sp. BL18I3N2]